MGGTFRPGEHSFQRVLSLKKPSEGKKNFIYLFPLVRGDATATGNLGSGGGSKKAREP